MNKKINIFWFRRDLRLNDNHGLFRSLVSGFPVLPVFVFDTAILEKLNDKTDARVSFIYKQVQKIKNELEKNGSSLKIFHSTPEDAFRELTDTFEIHAVFTNNDYEPYAIRRDRNMAAFLQEKGIGFYAFKDHVIFEENEVVKDDGKPYTVFTT